MAREVRFIRGGELRSKKGDTPGITGIASVYTQQYDAGYFVETIKRGAFDRALSEGQDVRCLFNHDVNNLLGRTKSGTLRLADSQEGLSYDCDTDANTTVGRDVPAMIDRGDLDGCSFSFSVRKDKWSDEFDANGRWVRSVREIEDLDLYDVGPVTFPAYTDTSVKVRAQWPDGVPAEVRSHVPALRRSDDPAPKPPADPAAPAPPAAQRDDLDGDNDCNCPCQACLDGRCEDCDCTGCQSTDCGGEDCGCEGHRSLLLARAQAHIHASAA